MSPEVPSVSGVCLRIGTVIGVPELGSSEIICVHFLNTLYDPKLHSYANGDVSIICSAVLFIFLTITHTLPKAEVEV